MADKQQDHHQRREQELSRRVGKKETRKLRARHRYNSIWFGLGTFGIIGWSVSIPILIGIFIGAWIDSTWPSQFSWTLMLLLGGVVLGCMNAWRWIDRESRFVDEEEDDQRDA